MEGAKRKIHKQGLDGDVVAVISEPDQAHSDEAEQAGSNNHTDANVSSEVLIERDEAWSEDTSPAEPQDELACEISGLDEDDNDSNGNTPRIGTKGQDDSATTVVRASSSLHEHHNNSSASPRTSDTMQEQSDILSKYSQDQPDSVTSSAEPSDSSQQQSHSSGSSSRTSTSSPGSTCLTPRHNNSEQESRNESVSGDRTSDLHLSSDTRPTVKGYQGSLVCQNRFPNSSNKDDFCVDEMMVSGDSEGARDGQAKHIEIQVHGNELVRTLSEPHATVNSWKSWETPPLDLNYEALQHIATTCLTHGNCVDITTLRRGGFHEIRVLHFEDGWSCIARFTRDYEMLCKTESELATIEHVRKHTTIPVPETYFVNHNENHVVGAPFVLMERMQGQPLCKVWAGLTLEHKLSVIGQLAHVLGQLAELRFDAIGSLKTDGTLGPLLNVTDRRDAMGNEPFKSTMEYFSAFLQEEHPSRTLAARKHYADIKNELEAFFDKNTGNPTLSAPYRLIHNDLDSQNILVTQEDMALPPKISGIIDWDWSYTGPLYYLCEYPHDICDWDDAPENYTDNKVLRKHFVATLIEHFPEESPERKHIKQCFREKSFMLNTFEGTFLTRTWPESLEGRLTEQYLKKIRGGCSKWERLPYSGRFDWERDSDLTDSDMEDSQSQDDADMSDDDSDDDSEESDGTESSTESVEDMDATSSHDVDVASGD